MALKLKGSGSGLESLSLAGRLAIGVLFTLMVGAGYFVIFYGEVENNITSQQQAKTQKESELTKAKEADKAFNKDLTELERRKQVSRKQKKILPDDAETPGFLSTLQTVATISGVKLTTWTPMDEKTESYYAKVPMKLKLEGKYHQIAKFFNGVGQVDRIINMENIVIASTDTKATKAKKRKGGQLAPGEDSVHVKVECLATAFRALKGGAGTTKRKRGKKRGAKK